MRNWILILLLFITFPAAAQNASVSNAAAEDKGVLVKNISIDGFVLGDREQFVKLFKPYRNKHLTTYDMDGILQKIQVIYEREGYLQLVSITYQVIKHRLVFTVLMTT